METIVKFKDGQQESWQAVNEVGIVPGLIVLKNEQQKLIAVYQSELLISVTQPGHDTKLSMVN